MPCLPARWGGGSLPGTVSLFGTPRQFGENALWWPVPLTVNAQCPSGFRRPFSCFHLPVAYLGQEVQAKPEELICILDTKGLLTWGGRAADRGTWELKPDPAGAGAVRTAFLPPGTAGRDPVTWAFWCPSRRRRGHPQRPGAHGLPLPCM